MGLVEMMTVQMVMAGIVLLVSGMAAFLER